jgi:HEAT repeat protein
MNKKYILMSVTVCTVVLGLTAEAIGKQSIEEKIDSLFVMASSLDIKYRDSVGPSRESIAVLGTDAVPHLIEMLGTPHGRERAALEDIFKKIGETAVPQLTEALLTTDSLRLSRVAKMLYFFPDTSSVENLLKVAENPYYSARYQAIRALGAIGDHRATPAIRKAMKDTIELVRTIAVVSAGRMEDASLFSDLLAAFDDNYYGARMSAHEALKNADCEFKSDFILRAFPGASRNARKHLLKILAEDSCQYEMGMVQPFLNDNDPLMKSLALQAAFRIDSVYVRQFLLQLQDTGDSFILHQTINELTGNHETQSPENP